jgi:proline dehydrogenase
MEQLMRNIFLYMANNRLFNKMAKKYGLRFGAGRFVAGASLESAIRAIRELNGQGMKVTVDHLGEFVNREEEANEMAAHSIRTLEKIAEAEVDSNVSLKITSMGLDISRQLCIRNMQRILETAQKHGNFIRIDMEDYAHLEQTLDVYDELRESFDNVGLVLQSYLYRAEEDLKKLSELNTNLRLVKGAYKESPQVAYPDKKDVDDNLKRLIELQLEHDLYAAVATHDEAIIEHTKRFVREHNIPQDRYEFQMLYGIRTELQKKLVDEGYTVRIYVPYGNDWYGYFMRRLAERPANVGFVLKGILKK